MTRAKRGFEPINLLFGLMMGTADVVPGVSGGTMALIVGIYERLIGSIRAGAVGIANLARGRTREGRRSLSEVEWGLVLPLGLGIVTAIVVGARVIVPVLESYPVQFRALFFGLIAGSLVIPWRRMGERRNVHRSAAIGAAIAAFLLVGLPPGVVTDPALPVVFLAASVAICAMILPGVSGAFLLLVMGMYEPTLRALNAGNVAYVAVFVLGAFAGLGVFSKLLSYLLRSHHDLTMAALVGLMAGSLRALWPYQDEMRTLLSPPSVGSLAVVVVLAILGFALVHSMTRWSRSLDDAGRVDGPAGRI